MQTIEKNIELLGQSTLHYLEPIDMATECYTVEGGKEQTRLYREGKKFKCNIDKELHYIKEALTETNTLYIYIGLSCVKGLKYMLEHMTEGSRIVLIEKNKAIFAEALHNPELAEIIASEKVKFIVAEESRALSLMLEGMRTKLFFLSGKTVIYFEEYLYYFERAWVKKFNKQLLEILRTMLFSVGNDIEDTLIGIKNIIRNTDNILHSTAPHAIKITKEFENKPAIVVAAGPSLNKQLPLLKKMKGKALILAVDTALELLLKQGIIPDVVTTAERVEIVYEMFYKDIPYQEEVAFVGLPVADPRIFDKFKHHVVCYRKQDGLSDWINALYGNPGIFESGMSCAHIGFGMARYLGCSPIILIGQDLAYGKGDVTHASGTKYDDNKKIATQKSEGNEIKVKGYDGESVYTQVMWNNFRAWYERMIDLTEGKVYNCTEGGAYIEGAVHIPFAQACEEISAESVPSFVEVQQKVKTIFDVKRLKNALYDDMNLKIEHMKDIQELATEAVIQLDDILETDKKFENKIYTDEELEEMIAVLHNCDEKYREMRKKSWFMTFFQGHLSKLFYEMSLVKPEFCKESVLANVRIQFKFYYYVHTSAQVIVAAYEDSLQYICLEEA